MRVPGYRAKKHRMAEGWTRVVFRDSKWKKESDALCR